MHKEPGQEDALVAIAAVSHLSPDRPGVDHGSAGGYHAPDDPAAGFVRSDHGLWRSRREGATPTRFSAERFEPHSPAGGLRTQDGQVSGKITQIRYDLRHFEVAPGKWVLEFTVPLDLVSPDHSIDANTRRRAADELQSELDERFNYRDTWPGKDQFQGSQLHFTVEAATPNGITRGWDADPTQNVPVEIRDSTKGDPFTRAIVPHVNQVQWDLGKPASTRAHEYFHFLGLWEGYPDPKMLFDHATGRGGIMGDELTAAEGLTSEQAGMIRDVQGQARPVHSHSLTDNGTNRRPKPNPADPGDLVDSIYIDGPYSRHRTPTNAPRDPKGPPPGPGNGRHQKPSDLPAMRSSANRPSRQAARDAKYDVDSRDERPVPVPARASAADPVPVRAWSLDEAGDWFTTTMAEYFAGRPDKSPAVPFLSGGAALARQGGVRPPKDLDFRITAGEVGFKDFSDPAAQRFLDHLNQSALKQLQNDYRARLKRGEAPKGAQIGEFAPLRKSGVGSTSMGSLNILGQEISLTVVPNDRPGTTRVGGDGPGKDVHVLTPDELVADKLRTMISRTKTDEDSVKKVAQDVFDVLDAMDVADRDAGRSGPTTAEQLDAGLAARAEQYSETNLLGTKLSHWSDRNLHDLMTGHAVATAQAHLRHGERRRALEKLLDNVWNWGGRDKHHRMWQRLTELGDVPVRDDVKQALRPVVADWNDRAQYGPGPDSRGSGRPEVRPGATPGELPSTGGETPYAPLVEDLLNIHADDVAKNVRDALVERDPKLGRKNDSTADAEQVVRVLAFSGGFRSLADSSATIQTQEAFGLRKNEFGKAFAQLKNAGFVADSPDGLRLRKAGWQLVPTSGPQRVVGLDGRSIDPPPSPASSPPRSREHSPERPATPDDRATIEQWGREAGAALAAEKPEIQRGLRSRAMDVLHDAGWHDTVPGNAYRRAVDIVAQSILDHDTPRTTQDLAESLAGWRDQAGDTGRTTDGAPTHLPPPVREQWQQARQVVASSKLPPDISGWIATRASQIVSDHHPLAGDQALKTIVTAQLLRDHADGLPARAALRNAIGVAADVAKQVHEFPNPPSAPATHAREVFAKPVPPAPHVLTPRLDPTPAPERSFDVAPEDTRLGADQRPKLDTLVAELAEANETRARLGYLPPSVEVSGDGARVVADALAERGVDATVRPGRAGGADVHVDWELKRPNGYVPDDTLKRAEGRPSDRPITEITWDPPEGTPIVRQDPVSSILDDPRWAHSTEDGAPWFDPAPDHIPSAEVAKLAATAPVSARVRGEQGGLTTDSIITPDGAKLTPWRGPIAHDIRRFDVPGGKGGVQDHHVKVFLDRNGATDDQVRTIEDNARAGVDELYNQGHRMANGRRFHVSVEFVTDPGQAHGVVRVDRSGGRANQLSWPVDLSPRKLAHEIGHFLGAHDQYFEPGPVKPVFQHQDGRGRVVSDNGVMTAGLENPDARLKPRDVWRIENRQRDLEVAAPTPEPHPAYPAPPQAPGGHTAPPSRFGGRRLSVVEEAYELESLPPEDHTVHNGHDDGFWSDNTPETAPRVPPKAPTIEGPLDGDVVRSRLPEYLAENRGAGKADKPSAVTGADVARDIGEAVPALRDHDRIKQLQHEFTTDYRPFVGEHRREPVRIVVGKDVYEVHPKAEHLWDQVEVVDPDAEAGTMKPGGDKATSGSNTKQSHAHDNAIVKQASVTAMPPLTVTVKGGGTVAPNETHEVSGQRKTKVSTEAEVKALHRVRVPVRLSYSIFANGEQVGAGRAVTGKVEVDVPLTLGRRADDAVVTENPAALPPAPHIEELFTNTKPGNGFAEQAAALLGNSLTEFRSSGRGTLQNFFSDSTLKAKWHAMAVTEDDLRRNPDAGWQRSDAVVKGPDSTRWSNKASQFEMRAVARRVEVVDTVPDVKSTDTKAVKDGVTRKAGTSRGAEGSLAFGVGADVPGAVYLGAGPAGGGSVTHAHAMEHTDKSTHKTSIARTGDEIRYRTEHVLQVRPLGGAVRTLDGAVVTYQSSPYDRAAAAGLVPPRVDGEQASEQRFPPPWTQAGKSLGGSIVDDFKGGDNIYRAVAQTLRKLPGRKWYHMTRSDYVVEFGDIRVASYSRGLKASVENLLSRSDGLRKDISDEHLAELVDTMLTDRGVTFTVKPKNALPGEYGTTVNLKATLDRPTPSGRPAEFTVSSEDKEKQTSKVSDDRSTQVDLGVQPRFWHPFGSGLSQSGNANIGGSKVWSHGNDLSAKSSEITKRTHGPGAAEDGKAAKQRLWPFGANLTITPTVTSTFKPSIGLPGRSAPESVSHRLPARVVPLRVLVPEQLTSSRVRDFHTPLPTNVRRFDHVPKPNELTRKAPRILDDVDVVAVFGTDHLGDFVDEQVHAASGDPVDARGPDGRAKYPHGARAAEDQLTPDSLRRNRRRFEPITVDRDWKRKWDTLEVGSAVVLTPSNPRPVGRHEFQEIEKAVGAGTGLGRTDKTTTSFGITLGDTVTPVADPFGTDPVVRFRGTVGGDVTPVDVRWGQGKSAEYSSSSTATVKSARLVKETLVWADLSADVVADAKYTNNIDKAKLFPAGQPRRAGGSFDLPKSMLVWATDEQIEAMRSLNRTPPVEVPAAPRRSDSMDSFGTVDDDRRDSVASVPDEEEHTTLPAPVSVVDGKGVSLGVGAITTTVDVRDRMPHLHRRLAESLDEQAADALLPKSRHDSRHDNHAMVDRMLSNVNRAAGSALNGEQIAPLRRELGRWKGHTYFLSVGARFVDPPAFTGIEHVDKLAVSDSVAKTDNRTTSSGRTVGKASVLARPGVGMTDKSDPAAAHATTGHGAATGSLATGLGADASVSKTDHEVTRGVGSTSKQSAETSGPMASYDGRIALDLRIERGFGIDEHGTEVAHQEVARDSAAQRDVTLLKLPEEAFPAPAGDKFGAAGPESWSDAHPRPGAATAEQNARWRDQDGHVALTEPGASPPERPNYERGKFVAEHYFGDIAEFRARAEQALLRVPGVAELPSRTIAELKAAATAAAVKAGSADMMAGRFTLPLTDFDLEVHLGLDDRPRLSGASDWVDIEAKGDTAYKDKVVSKTGHAGNVTGLPVQGSGGVNAPAGRSSLATGRNDFGSVVAGTQANNVKLGGAESVLEREDAKSGKASIPKSLVDPGKITQVDLHDAKFRFVARRKGATDADGAGVAELPVSDAYAIRHYVDPAKPLPEEFTDAVTKHGAARKAWTEAVKELDALRLRRDGDAAAIEAAEAKRARAQADYWSTKQTYDTQLVAARATQAVTDAAHAAERAAAKVAAEVDRAVRARAESVRAEEFAKAAQRAGQSEIAANAWQAKTEQDLAERDAIRAAHNGVIEARDAARTARNRVRPSIMDSRRGAQRHVEDFPALNEGENRFVLDTMRAASLVGNDFAGRAEAAAERAAQAFTPLGPDPRGPGRERPSTVDSDFWREDEEAVSLVDDGDPGSSRHQGFFVPMMSGALDPDAHVGLDVEQALGAPPGSVLSRESFRSPADESAYFRHRYGNLRGIDDAEGASFRRASFDEITDHMRAQERGAQGVVFLGGGDADGRYLLVHRDDRGVVNFVDVENGTMASLTASHPVTGFAPLRRTGATELTGAPSRS